MTTGEQLSLSDALRHAPLFTDGDWVESKDQNPDGQVRLIQLADVGDGYYVDKSSRFLTSDKARELRCTFIEPGDVLVARMPDPLGRACIFPGDKLRAVTVVDVCIIRVNRETLDSRWLMHLLNSPGCRRQIAGFATGTTRSRISRSNLGKIEVTVPPVEEQRRIALVLDKADELRTKRRSAHSALRSLAGSMFIALFGDLATNPRAWPVAQLKEAVELVQIGPFGSLLHQSDYIEGGVPVINPMHIVNGRIRPDSRHSVAAKHIERLDHYVLRRGDVVMGRRGEMGRCAVVGETEVGMLCGSGSLIIRPDPHRATADYLEAVLSSAYMKRSLEHQALGVTMANLNSSIIEGLMLPVPDLGEQLRYGRLLERLSRQERKVDESQSSIDQLFCSLQQRAFQGTL